MEFEINMINVEDGDAIILQLKKVDKKALIVIDGGYRKHYPKLKKQIEELLPAFENKIDLIICSHYDNDHLEGISLLLDDCNSNKIEIGEIWMHKIEDKLEDLISGMEKKLLFEIEKTIPEKKRNMKLAGLLIEGSYDSTVDTLVIESYTFLKGLIQKMIGYGLEEKIREVKKDDFLLGFEEFKVVSPTIDFYNSFLPKLKEEKFLNDVKKTVKLLTEGVGEQKTLNEQIADTLSPCERLKMSSLNNGVTPTNMVSIVTLLSVNDLKLLFTADSGIESYQTQDLLTQELKDLDWLQLPHHGSKNNTSKIMLDFFNPKVVFVSGKGIENRPDSAIVKCLETKKPRLNNIQTTNSEPNTWYLKFDQNCQFDRVYIAE